MTELEQWAELLTWGETLSEQRERLVRLVLSKEQLAERGKLVRPQIEYGQLKLEL